MNKTVITPPRRLNLPSWKELWEAREVAYRFGQRDVVLRYRQTAIGIVWVLLQPAASAGIFSIVFGGVAQLPTGGIPYFLFSYAGMLIWTVFSGVLSRSASSLVNNQALVAKVFFPRALVPVSTVFAVMLDFLVGLAFGVVLLVIFGVAPDWHILLLPLWTLGAIAMGLGIGFAASAIMVKYRDIAYILPWLLQVGLYATPVAFSLEAVPPQLRWAFALNPLTWLLEGFRASFLGTTPPPMWQAVGTGLATAILLFLGLVVFQGREREFADLI